MAGLFLRKITAIGRTMTAIITITHNLYWLPDEVIDPSKQIVLLVS